MNKKRRRKRKIRIRKGNRIFYQERKKLKINLINLILTLKRLLSMILMFSNFKGRGLREYTLPLMIVRSKCLKLRKGLRNKFKLKMLVIIY